MPTTNQLVRKGRKRKKSKPRAPALRGNPQLKGVVLRTYVIDPRKPNSANRKVARVRLSNGMEVTAYITGHGGHRIQEHSLVLVRGGVNPDLPGIRYRVVRGVLDHTGVEGRMQARSKYGTRKPG